MSLSYTLFPRDTGVELPGDPSFLAAGMQNATYGTPVTVYRGIKNSMHRRKVINAVLHGARSIAEAQGVRTG